jgi:large subunit ribosomal protein L17
MRHRVAGRKLGRTTEHRVAMMRNMSTALFRHEKITTTLAKAKELRPFAERLVTMSKKETLHARRMVLRQIHDRSVVAKLFDSLSARYAQRPGGYTRIIKLGPRRGDHAEMAIIELVGAETVGDAAEDKPKKSKRAKAPTKRTKAKPAADDTADAADEKPKKTTKTKSKPVSKKTKTSKDSKATKKTGAKAKKKATKAAAAKTKKAKA